MQCYLLNQGGFMEKVAVSTRIPEEMVRKIAQTGNYISDVIQVGLGLFFELPVDRQQSLLREHSLRKKREKALKLYGQRNIVEKENNE